MRQQRTPSGVWLLVAAAALTVTLAAAFSLAGVGYCSSSKVRAAAAAGRLAGAAAAAAVGSSIGRGRVAAAAAPPPPSAAAAAAAAATAAALTSCLAATSDSSSNGSGRRHGAASRREAWQEGARTAMLWSLALGLAPAAARASDAAPPDAVAAGPRRWISGKGEKPKGNKDRTGTKRDSNYLRCLSDCTTECRKPGQGLSRDSEDCLELCQDYCCQTYEQCTYLLQPE